MGMEFTFTLTFALNTLGLPLGSKGPSHPIRDSPVLTGFPDDVIHQWSHLPSTFIFLECGNVCISRKP